MVNHKYLHDRIVKNIRKYLSEHNMMIKDFCEEAGISVRSMESLLHETMNPGIAILIDISQAMGCTIEELIS